MNASVTRKHSSRMHTARLQPYVLWFPPDVSTSGGCPQVNKFEQVSSDGHQISLAGSEGVPCLGVRDSAGGPVQLGPMHYG